MRQLYEQTITCQGSYERGATEERNTGTQVSLCGACAKSVLPVDYVMVPAILCSSNLVILCLDQLKFCHIRLLRGLVPHETVGNMGFHAAQSVN